MSRHRVYQEESINIINRFFLALTYMRDEHTLQGGIQGFCNRSGIEKRHLYAQMHDQSRGFFQPSWLVFLVRDYNVSIDWLILGKGEMFNKNNQMT